MRSYMLSVIIPVFNEENAIVNTINRLMITLNEYKIEGEVIIVDDGCTDNTRLKIKESPYIKVLSHPHNIGYGMALKTGILAAKFPTIAIIDADGTYPPESIPVLLEEFNKGFDMVVGARSGEYFHGSAIKWQMRYILKFLVEWTTGRNIPDINSGMRIFEKDRIIKFFPKLCNTFSFTTSATLSYMMSDLFVSYITISYEKRIGNSHVRMWRDSLRTFQFILQAVTFYNPLKLFLLLTILTLLFSIIALIIGICFKINAAFFMSALSISTSFIIFSLGILAELVRQSIK